MGIALQQMNDEILDVRAAAREIGAHPETVRRHIRAGRLPAKKFGVTWIVRRVDLVAFASSYRPARGPAFRGVTQEEAPAVPTV